MRSLLRPALGLLLIATTFTFNTLIFPHLTSAAAQKSEAKPKQSKPEFESALPGYKLHRLTKEEAKRHAKKLISQDDRVAKVVKAQLARLEKLGVRKPGDAETVTTAVTIIAQPSSTTRANTSGETSAKYLKASLQDDAYVTDGTYEVTLISSQGEDVDFEYTPFIGTVYRRTPWGASDVWTATLSHGESELVDLGSTREQVYGAANVAPLQPRISPNRWLSEHSFSLVNYNAIFRTDGLEAKHRCYRVESDLCRRGYNRDLLTAGGTVILGSLACTGLSGGTLVTLCTGGGLIAYAFLTGAAKESRAICAQNALAKCYGADAYFE